MRQLFFRTLAPDFEIKVRIWNTNIEKGIITLNELESKIDRSKMKAPAFKMVLTAVGQYAGKRLNDGVLVVPIGCLKP